MRRDEAYLLAVTLAVIAIMVAWAASMAWAHNEADWIRQGGWRNRVGELCCGEQDCGVWSGDPKDGDIVAKADGYHVDAVFRGSTSGFNTRGEEYPGKTFAHEAHEVIPYSEAAPSPDGKFWRCQWGGSRKCFFAPPPST